jgi:hypothetical protein
VPRLLGMKILIESAIWLVLKDEHSWERIRLLAASHHLHEVLVIQFSYFYHPKDPKYKEMWSKSRVKCPEQIYLFSWTSATQKTWVTKPWMMPSANYTTS